MKMEFWGQSHQGLERNDNQDDYGYFKLGNGKLFIVADGMGGEAGGRTAAMMAIETIKKVFDESGDSVPVPALLKHSIEEANKQVYRLGHSGDSRYHKMGTTVVILFIKDGKANIAHIGDSRIYLYRNGRLSPLTKDHSQVQQMVDGGLISPEDAEDHPDANIITRSIGAKPDIEADVLSKPVRIMAGDRFLLCTDGLCGLVNDKDIHSIVAQKGSTQEICEKMIEVALQKGGHDNVTVQLVSFKKSIAVEKRTTVKMGLDRGLNFTLPKFGKTGAICLAVAFLLIIALVSYKYLTRTRYGTLRIVTKPEGAEILIDDKKRGESPFSITLPSGNYKLDIKKEGYVPLHEAVDIQIDKTFEKNIPLEMALASLSVTSNPLRATVILNNNEELKKKTPYTFNDIKVGKYKISVTLNGYNNWEEVVELVAGDNEPVTVSLVEKILVAKSPKGGNVRKDPNKTADKLFTLKKGDKVKELKKKSGEWCVVMNGEKKAGWRKKFSSLEKEDDKVFDLPKDDSGLLFTQTQGKPKSKIYDDGWYLVEKDGEQEPGWAHTSIFVESQEAEKEIIVYKKPEDGAHNYYLIAEENSEKKNYYVSKGESVSIIHREDEWLLIMNNENRVGWVKKDDLGRIPNCSEEVYTIKDGDTCSELEKKIKVEKCK